MMTKDEALKLARDYIYNVDYGPYDEAPVLTAIDEALAQPAQETASVTYKEVAKMMNSLWTGTSVEQQIAEEIEDNKLYTTPPAAQPAQEPVAWGFKNSAITGSNRWMMLRENVPLDDQYKGALWTPLYTTPPAAQPAQEPVAWAEEIIDDFYALYNSEMIKENDSGDELIRLDAAVCVVEEAAQKHTTPPQRPWVGLTKEERKEIMRYEKDFWGVSGWEWKCMEALESKLKEKNT